MSLQINQTPSDVILEYLKLMKDTFNMFVCLYVKLVLLHMQLQGNGMSPCVLSLYQSNVNSFIGEEESGTGHGTSWHFHI